MKNVNRLVVILICTGAIYGCVDATDSGTASQNNQSTEATSGRHSVAFVTNQIADFWTIAEVGAQAAAKEFDIEVTVVMPPEATAVVQKQNL